MTPINAGPLTRLCFSLDEAVGEVGGGGEDGGGGHGVEGVVPGVGEVGIGGGVEEGGGEGIEALLGDLAAGAGDKVGGEAAELGAGSEFLEALVAFALGDLEEVSDGDSFGAAGGDAFDAASKKQRRVLR